MDSHHDPIQLHYVFDALSSDATSPTVDREQMNIKTGNRACKYEGKVLKSGGRKIVKAFLEKKELGIGGGKGMEERERYLNGNGWSKELVRRAHKKSTKLNQELIKIAREVSKQGMDSKMTEA